MVDRQVIDKAINALRQAAPPGSRIFLFGSYAAGTAHAQSDLDLLVVEPHKPASWKEPARLRRAIGSIGIPVDVLVIGEADFALWKNAPNSVYHQAATKGTEYASLA